MAPIVRPQIHPLLIDHVIDLIKEQRILKPKDLLNMRAVCKQWNTQVTKEFSKQMALNLCGPDFRGVSLMHEVISMMEDPNGNFPLPDHIQFNSSDFGSDPAIFKFIHMFADSVTVLKDKSCRFNILDMFGAFQYPKLKKFEVTVRKPWIPALPQASQILAHRILRGSPLLEKVSIIWALPRASRNQAWIAIEVDLLKSIPLNLKKLSISKALRRNSAQLLSSFNWSCLTSLNLDFRFGTSPLKAEQFCGLFNNCNDTLTELSVTRYQHAVKFPVFPRLTKLTLGIRTNFSERPTDHQLNDFSYHFPAVETLNMLLLNSISVFNALFPENSTAPKVLICKFPFRFIDKPTYTSMCRVFPGVKTLHVTPGPYREKSMLNSVFLHMPDLEHLHVNFVTSQELDTTAYSVNLDWVFTGIRKRACEKMVKLLKFGQKMTTLFPLDRVKRGPGITDLKKLKALHIRAADTSQMTLTDVTGYISLLRMESLEVLQMDNFQVSEACQTALKSRFELLKLTTRGRREYLRGIEELPTVMIVAAADLLDFPAGVGVNQ